MLVPVPPNRYSRCWRRWKRRSRRRHWVAARNACVRERGAMHPLDRPVWASLTTHHVALSEGNELARRFARDVNLFASARDDTPEAVAELASLVKPEETIFILQIPEIVIPSGLVEVKAAKGVQMVAPRGMTLETSRDDIQALRQEDAPEMLALATLTEPGPYLARTPGGDGGGAHAIPRLHRSQWRLHSPRISGSWLGSPSVGRSCCRHRGSWRPGIPARLEKQSLRHIALRGAGLRGSSRSQRRGAEARPCDLTRASPRSRIARGACDISGQSYFRDDKRSRTRTPKRRHGNSGIFLRSPERKFPARAVK